MTDTEALAQRIERAYMEATGSKTPRGARAWMARLARLHPMSVSRILSGEIPPDRVEATLDAIETGRRIAARDGEE